VRNALPQRRAYRDQVYRAVQPVGVCHLCGCAIEPGEGTRDHVVPLRFGGTNDPSNLKPAHRACNSAKGAKSLEPSTPGNPPTSKRTLTTDG
jgi:5-methylcytosine-specific restriction endonuclease McrA